MAKERDWIDYANLASSLAQNLQLRRANHTLEGMGRIAAERAAREQEQHDQERQLDRLREHISQINDDVERLQEHLHENPRAALALGLQIKGLLEKQDVTTASFSAWEDKDRLKNVVKGLEVVCTQSTALLTEQQREDAVKCAKYLSERDALDQLIGLQRKKEVFDMGRRQFEKQIAAKTNELTAINSQRTGFAPWMIVSFVVGGLGVLFCLYCVAQFALFDFTLGEAIDLPIPGGLVFLVFLGSAVITSVPLFTPERIRQAERRKVVEVLEGEIANANAELSRYDETSPIKLKRVDPFGRDYERERERIMIERGELSQGWATQDRMDELHAIFGGGFSGEAYEAIKRRETLSSIKFGITLEYEIADDNLISWAESVAVRRRVGMSGYRCRSKRRPRRNGVLNL